MSVLVRPATRADVRQMAEIIGDDTSPQALADWMDDESAFAAWHVAEDDVGLILGFQRIGAGQDLDGDTCEVATFLRDGVTLAAGTRLFGATAPAARILGYRWIDARIAHTNDAARVYYQSHGFRNWTESHDELTMRFDLD